MNIDDLTFAQIKQLTALFPAATASTPCVWEIGKTYLVRTVTMIDTGRLVAVTDHELVLEDAAWIADTGRFSTALSGGILREVEPYPSAVVVNLDHALDITEWAHPLPRTVK